MKKIILGRVLAFGLMFGMACTMMPNTVIKAAVESNSTEETEYIGDNEFTSYEELENGLKNVANVQQDSDTGIIKVTMQKNVVGRINFMIDDAHIIFNGNGKTLSGQGYKEPICLENYRNSKIELVGGGIYKAGYNNCIFTGAGDILIIRNAVIIGNLYLNSDIYAGLENGYKSYSVMKLNENNETDDYVNSQGMQLKNCVEDVNLYSFLLLGENFAVVPTNNEHVHNNLTKVEAQEATCTENGNKAYYKCSCGELFADEKAENKISIEDVEIKATGHKYVVKSDETGHWKQCEICNGEIEKQVHVSDEAATEEKAEICNVCGYVMHQALGHIHANHLTKVEEKKATCTENGNKVYYKCSCGELFIDANAENKISIEDVEIKATGHKYVVKSDETGHWKQCEICNGEIEKQVHVSDEAATEEKAEICNVCGYVMHQALGHIHANHLTKVEEKKATCTENGNKEYYKCSCGELFEDRDAQKKITLAEVEIEAKGHEYESLYDETQHWKKCKNCDAVTEKQEHTSSGEATEENAETCTVCGYVIHEKLQKESNDSSMQWQTLNKAKLVTEKAFADYKAGKESDKSDIANVVAQALKENNLSNVAYEIISYEKTEPTSTTEGKISGIVKLTIGGYSTQVPFNYVIAKVEEPQKPAQITGKGAQTTDGQIKISWIKADGADGYRIYASVCDGESNYKLIKDTKDLTGAIKNLNNKKSYKFYVVAYKNVDGKKVRICKSMIYHVVLSDSKYTNVKAIKVAKTSYTLNVGDKQKLNAKSVKQEKNKKLLTHAQEFRYSSSDTTVATVSKTGEITAKQSGSCIIYVVANNGVMKKIKVNVA